MDISGILGSIERAGGYAALFALFGIGLFLLANKQMNQQSARSEEREKESARKHDEELKDAQASAQEHRSDKLLLLASQEKLATTLQELSGVMKGAMTEQRETRREVAESRKEIAELRRDLANHILPKKSSARKPQVADAQ